MGWICLSRPIYPRRAGNSCFTNIRISSLQPALQTKDVRVSLFVLTERSFLKQSQGRLSGARLGPLLLRNQPLLIAHQLPDRARRGTEPGVGVRLRRNRIAPDQRRLAKDEAIARLHTGILALRWLV